MDHIKIEQEEMNQSEQSAIPKKMKNKRKLKIIKDKNTCKITFCEIQINNAKLWELNNEIGDQAKSMDMSPS